MSICPIWNCEQKDELSLMLLSFIIIKALNGIIVIVVFILYILYYSFNCVIILFFIIIIIIFFILFDFVHLHCNIYSIYALDALIFK